MGRDTWRYDMREKERQKRKALNPIWRGVGCVIIIFLTLGGYFFADWFLYQNAQQDWVDLPNALVEIPFAPWLPQGLLLKLSVAALFMIASYGVMSMIYAIFFPIKPGEYDAPPLKPGARRRE